MKAEHSNIFYFAMAAYAIGAIAMLSLPSGSDLQTAIATDTGAKPDQARRDATEMAIRMTETSAPVRSAKPARTADMTLSGNAAKF